MSDGTQVASTNRGSQALGAAVGALAFGGIGAIIGGLSASSTSRSGTRRLSIQVTIDDPVKPLHEVTFYQTNRKKGGMRGEIFFDTSAQLVAEFAAHLDGAIRKGSEQKSANAVTLKHLTSEKTIAYQIRELWILKEAGALTLDEFNSEKYKLLNGCGLR